MKAIEMFQPYYLYLKKLFVYTQYCIDNDIHVPVCQEFWTWVACASIAAAAAIVLLISRTIVKERLAFYRNRKRLEARKIVADEETMERFKSKA